MAPIVVVVAHENLQDALTPILTTEFAVFWPHEEIYDILWPGPPNPANIARHRARHLKELDSNTFYVIVVDTEDPELRGLVLAHTKWKIYKTVESAPEYPSTGDVSYYAPEGTKEREYAQYWMDRIMKMRAERIQHRPHLMLEMTWAHPEHLRRGYGSQAVMWGCQRADQIGCDVYVEATVAGRPLYEKMGFVVEETVGESDEHRLPGKPKNFWYFMRRPINEG